MLDDYDSCALLRRKAQDMAEAAIQGDECAPFACAYREQRLVARTPQALLMHGHDIMPGLNQQPFAAKPQILVELQLHAEVFVGTGMMCSRAASAP